MLALLDLLRERGLVAIVKADGERSSQQWTVLVTGAQLGDQHVRIDHDDVGAALDIALERLEKLVVLEPR